MKLAWFDGKPKNKENQAGGLLYTALFYKIGRRLLYQT
jgi:hypothetical protein